MVLTRTNLQIAICQLLKGKALKSLAKLIHDEQSFDTKEPVLHCGIECRRTVGAIQEQEASVHSNKWVLPMICTIHFDGIAELCIGCFVVTKNVKNVGALSLAQAGRPGNVLRFEH